jgi:hypothetical protein
MTDGGTGPNLAFTIFAGCQEPSRIGCFSPYGIKRVRHFDERRVGLGQGTIDTIDLQPHHFERLKTLGLIEGKNDDFRLTEVGRR